MKRGNTKAIGREPAPGVGSRRGLRVAKTHGTRRYRLVGRPPPEVPAKGRPARAGRRDVVADLPLFYQPGGRPASGLLKSQTPDGKI
jgi:hypothetical protein